MIRIEITCDHSEEPRAGDVKKPCESRRGRNLCVDSVGTIADAKVAVEKAIKRHGWHHWIIPALGRRKGTICGPCYARAKGEA